MIKAIRQMPAGSIWLESMAPVYHFMIDDEDWTWSPKQGLRFGKPEAPTCVVRKSHATLTELLQGKRDPRRFSNKG